MTYQALDAVSDSISEQTPSSKPPHRHSKAIKTAIQITDKLSASPSQYKNKQGTDERIAAGTVDEISIPTHL